VAWVSASYPPFPLDGHEAAWETWDGAHRESFTIRWENEGWTASGIVSREGVQYVLRLNTSFQVRQFLLFRDLEEPDLWLATDGSSRWGEMNGAHRPDLDGCYDLHLTCTPFSHTLPIRRLPLLVGHTADITVATVDVETLELLPEHQRYTRLGTHRWAFTRLDASGAEGALVEFDVDEHGLARDTPERFRRTG
jgi:uncharacterized protein